MNLKQCFLTNNDCYKANRKITVKGLMLHSTGANNPTLKRYVQPDDGTIGTNTYGNHWNKPGVNVCVHGFIGKLADGSIATCQTLPWNHRGWHAAGQANNTHIGVEICEDGLTDANYFNSVYKEATELFAMLCKQFNLNPLTDIICHCEGYDKGIASNHSDVMHWFPKFGKSMDAFRADVKALLGTEQKPSEVKPQEDKKDQITVDGQWGKDTTKKAQKVFGTFVDGIVSNQYAMYKSKNPGLFSSTFEWENNPGRNGSELIKAIQKKVGVTADGFIGPVTIKAMQKWLGTYQDGFVSNPSDMVKAFQKWLNKQ